MRIKASDEEGRMIDPYLTFYVESFFTKPDTEALLKSWKAVYIPGRYEINECSYIEFETAEDATAFCLRWMNTR